MKDDIINVHEDLSYETNLRFVMYNRTKVMKLYEKEIEIGSFSVPLSKLESKWELPHFFHIIDPDEEGLS